MDQDNRARRDFRLHYLHMYADLAATPLPPAMYWWERYPPLASMVDSVCEDWEIVTRLGGSLPHGVPPSRAALIAAMGLDVLPAPHSLFASARCASAFTVRCIAATASAQVLAARLRCNSRRSMSKERP